VRVVLSGKPSRGPDGVTELKALARAARPLLWNSETFRLFKRKPLLLQLTIIKVRQDGHPLFAPHHAAAKSLQIGLLWTVRRGPLQRPIEPGLGLRRVQPEFIIWNHLCRLDVPDSRLDLINRDDSSGVLLTE